MLKKNLPRALAFLLCLLLLRAPALAASASFEGMEFDTQAETLDFGDHAVKDWEGLKAFLAQFPNLKRVDMFGTLTSLEHADRLTEAFPGVRFGWTLVFAKGAHTVRTDQEAFSTLHGWCDMHRSEDFEVFKYCPDMKALDLGHNHLTDLSFLLYMPHLRVLILAGNAHIGSHAEILPELKELEYLELFGCSIKDLSFLPRMTSLIDLNVSSNKAPDWAPLKEMTWLKRLWVSNLWGVRMPKADQEALQAALPDTTIVFKGDPTTGGWREHPHYDAIIEMWKTGKYIPFEDSAPLSAESGDD